MDHSLTTVRSKRRKMKKRSFVMWKCKKRKRYFS